MKAYQVKVEIKNARPTIWRRCVIPAGITFTQLSTILNEIMGWTGFQLYEFNFYYLFLKIAEKDINGEQIYFDKYDYMDASETYIDEYLENEEWFTYRYDFGKNFNHRVKIEKILEDYTYNYPQIMKYQGACPKEGRDSSYQPKRPAASEKAMEKVNKDLKNKYFINYNGGDHRNQKEIMFDIQLDRGLKGSLREENRKTSSNNQMDTVLRRLEGMLQDMSGFKPEEKTEEAGSGETKLMLRDVIEGFKKEDLISMGKNMGLAIKPNIKMPRLVDMVTKQLLNPEKVKTFFKVLRDEEIEIFEQIRKSNKFYVTQHDDQFIHRLYQNGYIKLGDGDLAEIPQDIVTLYDSFSTDSFHQVRKQLSWLTDCFAVAEIIYGVFPVDLIVTLYNQKSGMEIDANTICNLFEEIPLSKYFIKIEDMFVLKMIQDSYSRIIAKRGNQGFYIPTLAEMEEAAWRGFFYSDPSLQELMRFLYSDLEYDLFRVYNSAALIQQTICAGADMKMVLSILEDYNIHIRRSTDKKKLKILLDKVWNNSRMMINGGFKLSELANQRKTSDSKKETSKVINFEQAKNKK